MKSKNTRKRLLQLIGKSELPLKQVEMARQLGVSRQRIGQLKKDLFGSSYVDQIFAPRGFTLICFVCGGQKSYAGKICRRCYQEKHQDISLNCSECGKSFEITLSDYKARMQRRKDTNWYCSRKCYGKKLGRNNIGRVLLGSRKLDYQLLWSTYLATGMKVCELARMFGVSWKCIYSALRKMKQNGVLDKGAQLMRIANGGI